MNNPKPVEGALREALERVLQAGADLRYDEYGVLEMPLGHLATKWDEAERLGRAALSAAPAPESRSVGRRTNAQHGHAIDCDFGLKNSGFCSCGRGFGDPARDGVREAIRQRILDLPEQRIGSGNSTWDDCEPIIYLRKRDVLAALAAKEQADGQ